MSDLKIFTENIEEKALEQIHTLVEQPAFENCKIRIMPDVHAGSGCVIGFTDDLGDKFIPNIVGFDIGCGMLCAKLSQTVIDLKQLDDVIHNYIPSGREVHSKPVIKFDKNQELYCISELTSIERFERAIGSLGGGNHFIEIDIDEDGNNYLVIHSGSRNLGKQVADYYQNLAVDLMNNKKSLIKTRERLIEEYKATGREKDISNAIDELNKKFKSYSSSVPKDLCYLTGMFMDQYLHDMKICQEYAALNCSVIATIVMEVMKFESIESFETVHNYIEHETNMVRKGAVSAKKDQMLLITINMKDGCLICNGKGNDDWNQSAPHGAGRIMSRSKAKKSIDFEEYKKSMDGIFTTSVQMETIDEAPMVYKPM